MYHLHSILDKTLGFNNGGKIQSNTINLNYIVIMNDNNIVKPTWGAFC